MNRQRRQSPGLETGAHADAQAGRRGLCERTSSFLLVIAILTAFSSVVGLSAGVLEVDGHRFEFLGVEYGLDGTSTWTYDVTSGRKPALSHWVLELDPSMRAADVVRASEAFEVNTDPTTHVYGIKFDDGYEEGEDRIVSFTLGPGFKLGEARIATKAAKNVGAQGYIPAPAVSDATVNTAPIAVDDRADTIQGQDVEIPVLDNDTDPDGDSLTVVSVTQPGHGATGVRGNRASYTPNAGYAGADSFAYTISDGKGAEALATVSVTVGAANVTPSARDDEASTDENESVVIDVTANDRDEDGTIDRSAVVISQGPERGTVSVHPTTGAVTYTPDPSECGIDTFEYTVEDDVGQESNTAEVVVTIRCNAEPRAYDDEASTDVNVAVVIDVTANDIDEDGIISRTTVAITREPRNGLASVNPTTGAIAYVPNPGTCGTDYFKYRVRDDDGALSNEARVDLTVLCNQTPTAEDDEATTNENTSVAVNVAANDRDIDGTLNLASLAITRRPSNGTANAHPRTGVVTYTPNPGACGKDTFEYTIEDDDGAASNRAVVTVEVLCNDPPLAIDDLYNVAEGASLFVSTPGVLANDKDTPTSPLSATLVSGPKHGRLSLNSNGSFEYTHDGSETSSDAFTYLASDGEKDSNTATASLIIAPTNDAPTALDDVVSTSEDVPVTARVLDNDLDPDGDSLSVDWVDQPANGHVDNLGAAITYTPGPDFHGIDTFLYGASDGHGETDTATVTVTVRPINDVPVAEDDSAATDEDTTVMIDVLANDSDPDADRLTIRSVTQAKNGRVDHDGSRVTYSPNADYQGIDGFSYVVSDENGGTATARVTVSVAKQNDRPIAADDVAITSEDTPVTISILVNDRDPDGDPLSVESNTRPRLGTALRSGSQIIYTPSPNASGLDSFTYTVSDGQGGAATASVAVTILAVNDAPAAQEDSQTTVEDTSIDIAALENDRDPDGDGLTIQSVTQPLHGAVANRRTHLTYTPQLGFSGTDAFTYTVSDGMGGTSTARITVGVQRVNDAPVAQNDSVVTSEGALVVIDVLANDSDPDGDFLVVQSFAEPQHGSALNSRTGITYIPDPGFSGVDTFVYTVSDGNGGTMVASVTVSVASINEAPIARDDSAITDEGQSVTVFVLQNDIDPDGEALSVESIGRASSGTVVNQRGSLVYTPNPGVSGVDMFTYTVSDGVGGHSTATVVVAVTPINDAPVPQDDSGATAKDSAVVIAVLANDSDPDGDLLTVASLSSPQHGSASQQAGEIVYTPDPGFEGVDSFTYTVTDRGGLTATASVTIGVANAGGGGGAEQSACEGRVVINEIAWAGTAADPLDEWIELRNLGAAPVDLTGWILRWRRTHPTSADEYVWKVVELSGVLQPSSASACDDLPSDTAGVQVGNPDTGGISWLITHESQGSASGYYVLERRRESTVNNVRANQLYDTERPLALELSDLGDVIMLVNPLGEVVDTANAANIGRDGWAAGSANTFGTMERIDPLGPDVTTNWHTNMGVVIDGQDAKGHLLRATPGGPSSPVIEDLYRRLGIQPTTFRVGETLTVSFSLSRQDRKATGWPWISTTRPGFDGAGAGGGLDSVGFTFSGRHESGDRYVLDIGTQSVPPGEHVFWIVFGLGDAVMVPIVLTP